MALGKKERPHQFVKALRYPSVLGPVLSMFCA